MDSGGEGGERCGDWMGDVGGERCGNWMGGAVGGDSGASDNKRT